MIIETRHSHAIAIDFVRYDDFAYVGNAKWGQVYDIILIDYVMPNLNGPDATRAIRKLGFTGPIIDVTGNDALNEDKMYFINAGANNVIMKPFKMPALVEMVDV